MKKYLFICKENAGRSQIAEGFYNYFTKSDDAWSAGVKAPVSKFKYLSESIIAVMAEDGVDISKQTVKQLTRGMVEKSENIIVVCDSRLCPGRLFGLSRVIFWPGIDDPKGKSYNEKRKIRDIVKKKIRLLIKKQ